MIRHLFERKASYQAELLAEAQSLVDDGLDLDFVLALFPDDAEWLERDLACTSGIRDAYEGEQPSYYFEASLKSKFVNTALEPKPVVPVVIMPPAFSAARTAVASMSVASVAAAVGVLALGFITAGDSVPGDWNYTFKLANERMEYTLSRGDGRVDIQLRHTEARVHELQRLSSRGEVSTGQLERIQREIGDLKELAQQADLDEMQRARLEGVGRQGKTVLADINQKQPDIPQKTVDAAAAAFDDMALLGAAGPKEIPTPTATPSVVPSASATPEQSATPTPTPTPTATETPSPSATADPADTSTPDPSATSTIAPSQAETATPSATTAP